MDKEPLVSVIIIFLNTEKFLSEAIESVLNQTYRNWELVLVDDGSTDNSPAIALDYVQKYPDRLRYLTHPNCANRGMSASRHLGFQHAKGVYLAHLDADDVWLPPKLAEQVAILEAHPEAAMVYGRTRYWYSWTNRPEDFRRNFVNGLGVEPNALIQPPRLLLHYLRDKNVDPCTPSILVRRAVIEAIGGLEAPFRGIFEDMVFTDKIFLKYPVFVADACWSLYRQHPDSCCSIALQTGRAKLGQPNLEERAYFSWLEQYLAEQGWQATEVWKALQKELWAYRQAALYRTKSFILKPLSYFKTQARRLGRKALPKPVCYWLKR
jgi:glycosyltransferase involved in cell wall biosynthesis